MTAVFKRNLLILINAIFDAITAAPLTEIDLHCCEKLASIGSIQTTSDNY